MQKRTAMLNRVKATWSLFGCFLTQQSETAFGFITLGLTFGTLSSQLGSGWPVGSLFSQSRFLVAFLRKKRFSAELSAQSRHSNVISGHINDFRYAISFECLCVYLSHILFNILFPL